MQKATAKAPANIAFVKYWGKENDDLTLPCNNSISMNLRDLFTQTTVDFSPNYTSDEVAIGYFGESPTIVADKKRERVIRQLDRLRKLQGINTKAKVVSVNNFPAEVGIASSASAFAALTMAICNALNIKYDEKSLSILTRLGGSGSACRSIPAGFVEWEKGDKSENSFAHQIAPTDHWDLSDVILVVSKKSKKSTSLEGHKSAKSSPYFLSRLAELPTRLANVREAIKEKNLTKLGSELEKEAMSLHITALTSLPPIWYWEPETISVIKDVYLLRESGLEAYFTIDAGPNVHLICHSNDMKKVKNYFEGKTYLDSIFVSPIGDGAIALDQHLF